MKYSIESFVNFKQDEAAAPVTTGSTGSNSSTESGSGTSGTSGTSVSHAVQAQRNMETFFKVFTGKDLPSATKSTSEE